MAVTLSARAGSVFKAHLRYWKPDRSAFIDTTGSHAILQIRETRPPYRTIVTAREHVPSPPDAPVPAGTVLLRLEPGHWRLLLDRTMTRKLPSLTRFELELVNNLDLDDALLLMSGVIRVSPEVSRVG